MPISEPLEPLLHRGEQTGTPPMISVVDYGMGNLKSVSNALEEVEAEVSVTDSASVLADSDGIVLPGVGAFRDGIQALQNKELLPVLEREIIDEGKPFLGICLGLQLLADVAHEFGEHRGLGWVEGTVEKLDPNHPELKVPHMGWNDVETSDDSLLYEGLDPSPSFYFVHSYQLNPEDDSVVSGRTDHGSSVTASIEWENLYAVQFHPEKSQKNGLQVMENFKNLC